jgi:purine nucleosidase
LEPDVTRKLLIDTDTASDDAVALVLALTDPRVDVLAITVVAGNVTLHQGVDNAVYTRGLCGATVPVYAGADRPLERELVTAQNVHGADGMGDIGLPLAGGQAEPDDAVDVIVELAHRHAGELTLVALGPLTNLALALRRDPAIATLFDRVVIMGGTADHSGNITPAAEFNVYVDPEAADVVFRSGMPIEMVGWDVSRTDAALSRADVEALASSGPLGEFCAGIQRQLLEFCREVTKIDGIDLPDPVTMAIAIDPSIATEVVHVHVAVETTGELTRGMTVVDQLGLLGQEPNTRVVLRADRDRFLAMLHEAGRRPAATVDA